MTTMVKPASFGVALIRPAVVAIDLHRGHLDPMVATMPAPADVARRVVAANAVLLDWARRHGVPVIHLLTCYRDVAEIAANPFWNTRAAEPSATRRNVLRHNLAGSPGCTVMPELWRAGDMLVDTKKRYDCFLGTDLDFTLKAHGITTLLITGVNTNSCVLATTVAANVRDYAAIVVEDCVDTMDGPSMHDAGLACIRTAFGWVMPAAEVMRTLTAPLDPATVA